MSSTETHPVHKAVMRHSLRELSLAISQGEDADPKDREGRTPLFYAVQDGEVAIAEELIRNGANVDLRDKSGKAPLHFAAIAYQPETARLLLGHGADVDAQDDHGNTPLFDAVFRSKGRGQMIELLVASGANKSLKNNHGVSPVDLAKSIANYDIAIFLE